MLSTTRTMRPGKEDAMRNAEGWRRAGRLLAVVCLVTAVHGQPSAQAGITARWVGQDKHDYCGAVIGIKPNGYQDVHITLSGLPRQEIAAAWLYGHGHGEWQYRGVQNQYGFVLVRKPGASTADLFFEPNEKETGRQFNVKLKFDDGTVTETYFNGGKADPDIKVPELAVTARWVGQETLDLTGPGSAVGPDGVVDAKIVLSRLPAKEKITSVLIEGADGVRWMYGRNGQGENSAEVVVDPKTPTEAALYFQPDRELTGKTLKLRVTYANGKGDLVSVVAGRVDPKLRTRLAALPKVETLPLTARWNGQDATGDVRVTLGGLPANRKLAAVVLSDGVRGVWAFKADPAAKIDIQEDAAPLAFRVGTNRTTAELTFSPVRNETGATLALRLVFADGSHGLATFPGGACDPMLSAPAVSRNEVNARPGDDLHSLVTHGGTVRLAKGNYALSKPLVLSKPIQLVGEKGTVLVFSQAPSEPSWSGAIKIHSGGVTLRDFALRFAGKPRFRPDANYGAAVIASTDNTDNLPVVNKVNVVLSGLTLEGPEASGPGPWEEALHLVRLTGVSCGQIVKCSLRGGKIDLYNGPWRLEDNVSQGVPDKTFSHGVFVVHDPLEIVARNNRVVRADIPSGKLWRFLVFVKRGDHDVVENNSIEAVGPRDNDTIPSMNAPETILTESYNLWFEGRPAALSADRRVLKLPHVDPAPDEPAMSSPFSRVPEPGNIDGSCNGSSRRSTGSTRPCQQARTPFRCRPASSMTSTRATRSTPPTRPARSRSSSRETTTARWSKTTR